MLWLAAALATISFALAATVRSEIERAETDSEGVRAYYVARGSVDRTLLWMQWGSQYRRPNGTPMFYEFPMPRLQFRFPSAICAVEIIPESTKYNVNTVTPQNLLRLLTVLGVEDSRAHLITEAILDWRSSPTSAAGSPFDSFYLSQPSSFRSPHASIRELEELLLVRGMTPELFYGNYTRDAEDRAVWHAGLRDCLTALGNDQTGFDINTIEPAVMASLGLPPDAINQIVAFRSQAPIRSMDQVNSLIPAGLGARLRIGGGSIVTLRATARLLLADGRASDLKRSVAAIVKLEGPTQDPPYTIIRWYDNAQSGIL